MPQKPYKIALVCDHFLPRIGGIELHIRDLAKALQTHGMLPHIITTIPGSSNIDGIKVHRLQASLLPYGQIIWNTKAFHLLKKICIQERFDIIHSHSSVVSPFAYASMLLAQKLKTPNVLTCHSLLENSVYSFRVFKKIYHWDRWSTVLTAISHKVADGLYRASKQADIPILPNGIYPQDWNIIPEPKEEIQITTVLRLHRKKRAQDLIRVVPHIIKKIPKDMPIRFNIIGEGAYRKKIERLIQQLKIHNYVYLLGYLPRQRIKEIFSKTDIFVLPTIKEAFGIAALEARCASLPIVAMNHGGIKDVVSHDVNGFLSSNYEEFTSHVVKLLLDSQLRKTFSEKSKIEIEKYSWPEIIKQHEKVYDLAVQKCHSLYNSKIR